MSCSALPNFLLSGPRGPARGYRGRLCVQSCPKVPEDQGARLSGNVTLTALAAGRLSDLRPVAANAEAELGRKRANPHGVNPIISGTSPLLAYARNSRLAANVGISLMAPRVDGLEKSEACRRRWWRGLALVRRKRRGSPQPPAVNAGRWSGARTWQLPWPESIGDGNRCAARVRLAATTRGSRGAPPVTAGRTDSERQARHGSARASKSSSY